MRAPLRGSCALWLVAAMLLNGCFGYREIRGHELGQAPGRRPEVVRVTLHDETQVVFDSPSLYDRGIDGTITACAGPSCEQVRGDRNVRFSEVSRIEAREDNTASSVGTAVGATLGAVLVLGLVGVVVIAASGGFKMNFGGGFGGGE